MMTLCLLLTACGATGGETEGAAEARDALPEHGGLRHGGGRSPALRMAPVWEAALRCDYVPEGETTVEVLSPETIAGVKAVLTDGEAALECMRTSASNAGTAQQPGQSAPWPACPS